MLNKGKKGISLIVLVITVVAIIILGTVIIVNIVNTKLIDNSKAAVFKSDVSNMKDELSMYIAEEYTDAIGNYQASSLQATEEGVWYGSTQQDGTITDIITSMDEKYVDKFFIQDGKLVANKMTITVEEEKWLNELGINAATQTDIGKIDITPSTKEWTNGNVELEINYTKEIPTGYAIEYKINNGSWQEGTRVVVEENNTKVTARLYSKEKDNEALTNSYTVANIDKVVPDITNMKIDITASTNSITAIASGATDTLSGEIRYQYSIDGTTWQDSGVFNGYKNATEVTVYAKAIDKVGNESASISNTGTTAAISAPILKLVNNEWTRNDVVASVTGTAPAGYELQYKLSGGMTQDWTVYIGNVTITENNTTMVARYYNKELKDEILSTTKVAAQIDKVAPDITNMKLTLTATENTITAVASGATDSLSGLTKYQYSINNSTWQDSGTFTGIKSGTATTVYAKAIDKVGNVSGSISNKGTTTAISGNVSIAQNPAATKSDGSVNWTKGNVSVTLSYSNIPSGYVIQYSLSGGMNLGWTAYSSAISVTANNTTVKARLYNATAADEVAVNSKVISNIDKAVPVTTNMKLTLSSTSNSVTAAASGATDALSGNVTYKYSKDNSTWQTSGTFSSLNPATSYTIYAKAVDGVGNESASINSSITTQKQNVTLGLSATSGTITYPSTGTFTVSSNPSGGTLSVKSSNTAVATVSISGTTVTITPGTTAGTSTITVTSAATTTANAASATYTVTVKNGTLSVSASGYSGTYNGSAHGISVSCSGATIKYGTSSGSYTLTSSPTYTNAGTYTVYYQVSKAGYTTVTGSKQVVISKAAGSVALSATSGTIEKSKTATFTVKTNTSGGSLSVSTSNSNVATASISGTTVTVTGKTTTGKATITVTSAATTNYNAASATYTISVTNPLLANVVAKGDYVNYPVSYTNIDSFCGNATTLTGWRVLYVSGGAVYLVSAGSPEKLEQHYITPSDLYNKSLNTNTSMFSKYINTTYSSSGNARGLFKSDLDTFNGTALNSTSTYTNNIIKIGGYYLLAISTTQGGTITNNGTVYVGSTNSNVGGMNIGMRVVVKLNSSVRTTGKNSSGVWQLTNATGL